MAAEAVVVAGNAIKRAEEEKKEKKSGITIHTTAGCGQHTGNEGATPSATPNPMKTCSAPALPRHFWVQFPTRKRTIEAHRLQNHNGPKEAEHEYLDDSAQIAFTT